MKNTKLTLSFISLVISTSLILRNVVSFETLEEIKSKHSNANFTVNIWDDSFTYYYDQNALSYPQHSEPSINDTNK